ncbi:hypothetical protein [Crocosphaera sp. XPORK-15E]|uniref:hypothetical protein n=1 Tax=Crocosphaera sp. XPORK-15E TaxID=3110247 RepID=UPI002B1F5CFD|nr:hypothetical protein [Crocosphaera sp. XPORK-15E]MEA5536733.1 hypothetical protein [Crocosphaera sp. XPORK-15E]
MKRSSRVLREFVLYYFPLYHLEIRDFFRFYPVLGFMEALVYETDEEVEEIQANNSIFSGYSPWKTKRETILDILEKTNLKHHCVETYLDNLGEYFALETNLLASRIITHQEIIQAAQLRSSDYRFLHCTLQKMLGQNFQDEELNEELRLMWPLEVLNDIEDDIESYQEDVANKHYNTYRMFVKIYGEKAPYYLKKELDYYQNLFHEGVETLSDTSFKYKAFQKSWNAYRLDHPVPIIPQPILEG